MVLQRWLMTQACSLCAHSRATVTAIEILIMPWGWCHRLSEPDYFLGPVHHPSSWFWDGLLAKLFVFDIHQYLLSYLF